jgi:hypothetical protein
MVVAPKNQCCKYGKFIPTLSYNQNYTVPVEEGDYENWANYDLIGKNLVENYSGR